MKHLVQQADDLLVAVEDLPNLRRPEQMVDPAQILQDLSCPLFHPLDARQLHAAVLDGVKRLAALTILALGIRLTDDPLEPRLVLLATVAAVWAADNVAEFGAALLFHKLARADHVDRVPDVSAFPWIFCS